MFAFGSGYKVKKIDNFVNFNICSIICREVFQEKDKTQSERNKDIYKMKLLMCIALVAVVAGMVEGAGN